MLVLPWKDSIKHVQNVKAERGSTGLCFRKGLEARPVFNPNKLGLTWKTNPDGTPWLDLGLREGWEHIRAHAHHWGVKVTPEPCLSREACAEPPANWDETKYRFFDPYILTCGRTDLHFELFSLEHETIDWLLQNLKDYTHIRMTAEVQHLGSEKDIAALHSMSEAIRRPCDCSVTDQEKMKS